MRHCHKPYRNWKDYKEILWRIYTNKLEDFDEIGKLLDITYKSWIKKNGTRIDWWQVKKLN